MNIKGLYIVFFISAISFAQDKPTLGKSFLNKDFLLGKINYKNHKLFIEANTDYTSKTIYLNKEVYTAFIRMFNQAKKDGISLKIISGTRNFNEQKVIWERKWKKYNSLKPIDRAKIILKYSSMPSTSRHHWGTDIDLNSFSNSYFEKGKGKQEYNWLLKNANKFDFYQVYTDKTTERTGYNLERWHWSYLPLANRYLNFYNKNISSSDIKGFSGSVLAEELKIITNFVNGISKQTKEIIQH